MIQVQPHNIQTAEALEQNAWGRALRISLESTATARARLRGSESGSWGGRKLGWEAEIRLGGRCGGVEIGQSGGCRI